MLSAISEARLLKVADVNLEEGILTINHSKKDNSRLVPMSNALTELCRDFTKKVHPYQVVEDYFFPALGGTPMTLGNLYKNFRRFLWRASISHGGKGNGPRIHDFRHTYAVHCLKKWVEEEKDITAYFPVLKTYMGHDSKERGLELSPEKTNITHINDGFNFLSQNIRKYENKLIIKPSKKSIKNFLEDIRATIRTNKSMAQEELIKILNPKLTGWANYHNAVSSASTFKKVSHYIWQALWQWCKRRHPKKNLRWIKSKYFHIIQGQDWTFACKTVDKEGKVKMLKLYMPRDIKIKRHTKIRASSNPFDAKWKEYFKCRTNLKSSKPKIYSSTLSQPPCLLEKSGSVGST